METRAETGVRRQQPRSTWGHQKRKGPRRVLPSSLRVSTALPTLRSQTFGLQNWERTSFWYFKLPSLR